MPSPLPVTYTSSVCRNIHDTTLPVGVQCTSVRLLLNLVEVNHARRADARAQETHRMLLARLLEACVARLSALCRALPHLLRNGAPRTPLLV